MTDQELFQELKTGSEEVLRTLYRTYRETFIHWAMNQPGNYQEEEAVDAFQESMIILYEKVQSGQINELRSSVKTLLFAIAKNRLRKQGSKELMMPSGREAGYEIEESRWGMLENNELAEQLAMLVRQLKAPCDQILYLFYYRNFSMESIANRLEYNNENVAKTQKNRCMKRLREMAKGMI